MKALTIFVCVLLVLVQSIIANPYVVTTKQFNGINKGNGYISFPATTFGQATTLTIAFDFATTGTNGCILGMGEGSDFLDVIVRNGKLVIRDYENEATLNANIQLNKYYHVILQFVNDNSKSTLTVFLSGKDVSGDLSTRQFLRFSNSQRKEIYAGLCKERKGKVHSTGAIYFGEFHILDRQLTSQEIKVIANPAERRPISDKAMIVYYPFNEGVGNKAHGVTGTYAKESFTASLKNFARFSTRNEQGTLTCESTGDPHITDFYKVYTTPKHQRDFTRLVSCSKGNNHKYFTINAFHDFGHPSHPKATLNRGLTVRYGSTVVRISLSLEIQEKIRRNQWVSRGTSVTNIGDLYFEYNSAKTTLYVYGSPFAVLKVNKIGTTHLNVYITASGPLCTQGKSYCKGDRNFISEIEYEGDDDVEVPPPISEPPVSEPYFPCEENPTLAEEAERVCEGKFVRGTPQFEGCVFDICATGDITIPEVDEDCIKRKQQLIADGDEEEANKLPCVNNPCNCVFGTCNVEEMTCECYDGYVGPDCSQESHLLNLTVNYPNIYNNMAINLVSHHINIMTAEDVISNPFAMNEWSVEDSLLLYVASVKDASLPNKYKYFLYLVGDTSSATSNQAFQFSYTTQYEVNTGEVKAIRGPLPDVNFNPFENNGLFFYGLGSKWCVNFDFTAHATNFKQVVVGSGNKLAKLDVLKVPETSRNSVQICGEVLENPCAAYTDCGTCMANPQCGWCRSNSRCLLGKPSGPVEGSSCPRWAFTFDDHTSRRVNAEFGVPLNPRKQEIFLVSAGDLKTLPVEVTVDMGHSRGAIFDVAVIAPTGSEDLNLFKNNIVSYLTNYRDFPDCGVAFATYDSSGLTLVQPLGAVLPSIDYLEFALNNVVPTNSQGDVNNALRLISTTKSPNWRTVTRHVVVIVVGKDDTSGDPTESLKQDLLAQSIFPIFIVRPNQKVKYNEYLKKLGFGAVLVMDSSGTNLGVAFRDTLDLASKAVALVPTQDGHLDDAKVSKEVWNIHGLQLNMRGRMLFPMTKEVGADDKTLLVAPGFGKATIENLVSDKPTPTSNHVEMQQEQNLPENLNLKGKTIELSGRALNPNDPISIEILGFGKAHKEDLGIGKFYQLPEDLMSFTSEDELAPYEIQVTLNGDGSYSVVSQTFIEDVTGKILYRPPQGEDAFSVSNAGKFPFTTIKYRVHDSCVASDPHEIDIYIYYENKPPVNRFITPEGHENKALLVSLDGTDERMHDLCAIVDELPYQYVNNEKQSAGTIYKYNQAVYNTLSSVSDIYRDLNLGDVLSSLTPVTVGEELCDNKVIYIPDRYKNSDNIPVSGRHQVVPNIAYHVIQVRGPHDDPADTMLTSATTHHSFEIRWVNQAPRVILDDIEAPESCSYMEECNFLQNLGVLLPTIPTPELLSAIATDVEEEPVDLIFTSVQCKENVILETIEGQKVTTGFVISNFNIDEWRYILRFRPGIRSHGDEFCTISYKASDGELESEVASIIINIEPVNQPPTSETITVNTYKGSNGSFEYYVFDYDDVFADGYIVGCNVEIEGYTFNVNINGVEFTSDECDGYNTLPLHIGAIPTNGPGKIEGSVTCETCPPADEFVMTLFLNYLDGHESERGEDFTSYIYRINVQYRKLNQPGYFWLGDDEENKSTHYYSVVTTKIPIQSDVIFPCGDIDINLTDDAGTRVVSLDLKVNNPGELDVIFDTQTIMPPYAKFLEGKTRFNMVASIPQMLDTLSIVKICVRNRKEGVFNLTYTYNDYGMEGYCPDGNPEFCKYVSHAELQYTSADTKNTPATLGGGLAAGAVVIGAAAAIGAWLRFRNLRAPSEGSDPWMLDDQTEGVVDNPMYEQRGVESENPLYEANIEEE